MRARVASARHGDDVLGLALYAEVSTQEVLRCVVEGARWLGERTTSDLPTKSAISQAQIRLGVTLLEALYRAVVAPIAMGAFPQLPLVGLLENGTHAIAAAQLGLYGTHELVMAIKVLAGLIGKDALPSRPGLSEF